LENHEHRGGVAPARPLVSVPGHKFHVDEVDEDVAADISYQGVIESDNKNNDVYEVMPSVTLNCPCTEHCNIDASEV
jgi:hypothetical protein